MTTPVIYDTRDLKIEPARQRGLSWLKVPGASPVLVSDARIVDEMAAYGVQRPSELGHAMHMFVEGLVANPLGSTPTPGLVFHEWVRCEPEQMTVKQARRLGVIGEDITDEEAEVILAHKYDPETECDRTDLRHTRTDQGWGHLVPDEPGAPRINPLHNALDSLEAQGVLAEFGVGEALLSGEQPETKGVYRLGVEYTEQILEEMVDAVGSTGADDGQEDEHGIRPTEAETEVRFEAVQQINTAYPCYYDESEGWVHRGACGECLGDDEPRQAVIPQEDPKEPRVSLDRALPVKDLADGVERVLGFLETLTDSSVGHKKVAEMFPFTSETSVRRWRKANGVVLS